MGVAPRQELVEEYADHVFASLFQAAGGADGAGGAGHFPDVYQVIACHCAMIEPSSNTIQHSQAIKPTSSNPDRSHF